MYRLLYTCIGCNKVHRYLVKNNIGHYFQMYRFLWKKLGPYREL